ncbi:diaminopropionate ammonia-lyase [Paraburkholderia sp. Ac-20342]|uniref:diaminopropionate ammonia-lyase n=1 Tax=Paraburkholderia sp. Ac-20342 TaxID=2703889 RepID=UPI00197D27A0|nr:diaminopropionate ammonia-lyase [Paraburkholderia sp. Ac-20342]MBN3846126.1 diaminopropionate ammonia-lyase [Paraburkholderia sp. Ac-20342]
MSREYEHHKNVGRMTPDAELAAKAAVENLLQWEAAVNEIHQWPEYSPQPMWSLDNRARNLKLEKLYYKDESQRFGRQLGSFKALGAPYAVYALLADEVEAKTGKRPTADQLRSHEFHSITERVTVCVATDGNQGRGLAYAAKVFGCRCVIYVHGHVSPGRKEAMEALGAIVIRINGEYEASVARAKEDGRINNWHFVSSTSWDNFKEGLPRNVMNAYMVMVEEALEALPSDSRITHVFMQGGVGSIAAAVFLGFAKKYPGKTPRFVIVEPTEADCLFQSAINGRPTPSAGSLHTLMAGLACREVSPAAWSVLQWLASDFIKIPDHWVVSAMRALADGGGDTPIVSGESASGGMGVLLQSMLNPELRDQLGLDENSQVLLFGCEGATDPQIYEQVVGLSSHEVFERQAERAPAG